MRRRDSPVVRGSDELEFSKGTKNRSARFFPSRNVASISGKDIEVYLKVGNGPRSKSLPKRVDSLVPTQIIFASANCIRYSKQTRCLCRRQSLFGGPTHHRRSKRGNQCAGNRANWKLMKESNHNLPSS